MTDTLLELNAGIKKEADEILYKQGLAGILGSFGRLHIHGSYALDLMTWRDLDIYLERDDVSEADFFGLGKEICTLLSPVKMSYRNELMGKTRGLPSGLYWGVYLGNERAGAWKIDIWVVDTMECERLLGYTNEIRRKLNSQARARIMDIKSQCWRDPEYRRYYTSADIYEAVLEHDVAGIDQFSAYRSRLKK